MASESGYSSMAIPALGTGQLKYPPEDVIAAIVTAVSCFLSLSDASSLREITLVVHSEDTKSVKVRIVTSQILVFV